MIINPLNPELNPICYLLALLGAHHFLHVSRIRVNEISFLSPADIKALLQGYFNTERLITKFNFECSLKEIFSQDLYFNLLAPEFYISFK